MADRKRIVGRLYLLITIFNLFVSSAAELKCDKKSDCSCELSDGSRTIDLKPLDGGKTAHFKDIKAEDPTSIYTYDFNPCTGMSSSDYSNCEGACVCQHSANFNYNCGKPGPAMNVVGKDVQFVYTGSEINPSNDVSYRTTKVTIVCDESVEGELSPFAEVGTGTYTTTLKTKHACGSSSGLSIGSILVIVFVSLLLIYFVAGILIMKFHRGAESIPEMIPNNSFWKSLPGLIKDGFLFFGGKIKGCCRFLYSKATGSGYQEV